MSDPRIISPLVNREAAGNTAPPACLELDIVGNDRKLLRTAVLYVARVCVKLEPT